MHIFPTSLLDCHYNFGNSNTASSMRLSITKPLNNHFWNSIVAYIKVPSDIYYEIVCKTSLTRYNNSFNWIFFKINIFNTCFHLRHRLMRISHHSIESKSKGATFCLKSYSIDNYCYCRLISDCRKKDVYFHDK